MFFKSGAGIFWGCLSAPDFAGSCHQNKDPIRKGIHVVLRVSAWMK